MNSTAVRRAPLVARTIGAVCVVSLALLITDTAATAASTGATAAATAASTNEVEGIWSFEGGAVAIQRLSDGSFHGTVVEPIKFATCTHPVGEIMWTAMREQSDGSFWGLHQWYHGACEPDPDLGPTAWRVLEAPSGEQRYLKVCFSGPGTSQPTIATDGTSAHASYGCFDSARLGKLPETSGEGSEGSGSEGTGEGSKGSRENGDPGQESSIVSFASAVELPSNKVCVERKTLKIHVKNPKYDPLEEVVVRIDGKRVAHVHGIEKLKKYVLLQKLPAGTYEISVIATTVLRQHLAGHRTYKACAAGSGTIKLHHHHRPLRPHAESGS